MYGYFFPGFVAKKSVINIIGVPTFDKLIGICWVDRVGTKEEKMKISKEIE